MPEPDTTPASRGPRRGLRILAWISGILLLLLITLYFVATSSAFFKAVVLPRASKSLNADITVSSASIRPFSMVVLHDLKVQPKDREPLLVASEVRARYSLLKILGGNTLIEEVAINKPVLTLVQRPDGSSNLDPLLESADDQTDASDQDTPSEPAQFLLRKLMVSEGILRSVHQYEAGKQDIYELSNLTLNLTNVGNGLTGKLGLGADVLVQQDPPAPATNGTLAGILNGTFEFGLTPALEPGTVTGDTRLSISRAEGSLSALAGAALQLDCRITPTQIDQVLLRFTRGQASLGQIRASGPFDMSALNGSVALTVDGIDRQLLSLAAASSGMDFGSTRLSSTNLISLTNAGDQIQVAGRVLVNEFQIIQTNQATPPVDFSAVYDVAVEQAKSNAVIRTLQLSGTQNNREFLTGGLTQPMPISWGGATNSLGVSELSFSITGFDLANWKALLGDVAPAGVLNAKLDLVSEAGGASLKFNLDAGLTNLVIVVSTNTLSPLAIQMALEGQAMEFKTVNLPKINLSVSQANQLAAQLDAAGTYQLQTTNADFRIQASANLPRLLSLAPQPDMALNTGDLRLQARIQQTGQPQTLAGSLTLTNLNGRLGSNIFRNYSLTSELDARLAGDSFTLARAEGRVMQNNAAGGNFQFSANYNLSNSVGNFTARINDFNQHGLGVFLQPALGEQQLVSIHLAGAVSGEMRASTNADLKGNLEVSNLVVRNPAQPQPLGPLASRLSFDARMRGDLFEIPQADLTLTPTAAASNIISFNARVDLSKTNAITGQARLLADSLDLTGYYDLYENSAAASESTPEQASTTIGVESEPEAMSLPLTNFVVEATINRLQLRELQITNFQSRLLLDPTRVQVQPFQMHLNGSPVSFTAAIDTGVAGYRYQFNASMLNVPFAPLVNTFSPENRDKMGGTLTAVTELRGAGLTGPNLQKNLAGSFDIGTTNLNLQISRVESPLLKTIVRVVAILPEIIRDPNAGVSSLIGSIVGNPAGGKSSVPGWLEELQKSPIDVISATASVGKSRAELQRAFVQSRAFRAEARGVIDLAPELTNSLVHIPLSIYLQRSLAESINFVPAGTPTNVAYVKLPDYVTVRGTVGNPSTDINKMALVGTALQQLGGNIPGVDQRTGNLLQGLGGILTGRPGGPATNAVPQQKTQTNTPPANQPGSLLDQLLRSPTRTTTNSPAPPSSSQQRTNQNPVGGLLNQLLGPGKQ